MPPGSELAGEPQGIQDKKILADLIKLAKDFQQQADEALAYEKANHATAAPASPVQTPPAKQQGP